MTNRENDLLDAARCGDESAFSQLIGLHRAALHAHCYRMLGSLQDAEDALQETLLNAWRALPRFEGRSSLKSWLYRIATNACLKAIERRPRRVLPIDYGPAADPHDPLAQPIQTPASGSRTGSPPQTPATSSARPSSSRSWQPYSTSRRSSGRS